MLPVLHLVRRGGHQQRKAQRPFFSASWITVGVDRGRAVTPRAADLDLEAERGSLAERGERKRT